MGVGLGPDSYAIIEQGVSGRSFRASLRTGGPSSKRPRDHQYKTKKRLAEAKLESSKLNLARVNDIVVEVEKQLASLKRQAQKRGVTRSCAKEMRGLLRQVMASKALELDHEAERLASLLHETTAAEAMHAQT